MNRTYSQPIAKVLEAFFEENPHMADKLAETRLMNYWNNELSPAISRYTNRLSVRNRVLYVGLTSAVLKNELMMLREQMIINLNREAGRQVIDDIVFC
jgi:predicted nucleic acid-binding Zn ribbon protein